MKRQVYSIIPDPPELAAYGMARYSRSSLSLIDSISQLSTEKAHSFLNTFYFQYGHSSIADLAHVALAIENISVLAALVIVDEPLWDGQERSTRYQDFRRTKYFIPESAPLAFEKLMDYTFQKYLFFSEVIKAKLETRYLQPSDIDDNTYSRTIRARAFDVSRYWLPLGTFTSLGQITNARTLERQISRLLSNELVELQHIANEMKSAVTKHPPIRFLKDITDSLTLGTNSEPVLPTLLKYADANKYIKASRKKLKILANKYFNKLTSEHKFGVELYINDDPVDHGCASLLYSVTNLSYGIILDRVRKLTEGEKQSIFDIAFSDRGAHDQWLSEIELSPLIFDITMDIGSFRDLNRHRRVSKILQDINPENGYSIPKPLIDLGIVDEYTNEMDEHFKQIKLLFKEWNQREALYTLPLGTLCRSLHKMDFKQLAYISELRTKSSGHFSYREIAYQMFQLVEEEFPVYAKYMRVTDPNQYFDPFER